CILMMIIREILEIFGKIFTEPYLSAITSNDNSKNISDIIPVLH
ncbi:22874_t:CDS:1, partial [Gigaspora rosea]